MTHQDAEEFGHAPNEPHDPQGRPTMSEILEKKPNVTFSYEIAIFNTDGDIEEVMRTLDQGDMPDSLNERIYKEIINFLSEEQKRNQFIFKGVRQ